MKRLLFMLMAAAALLFIGFAESADARKGGGFRGGGMKFRGGNFRSFKPMRFNRGFSRGHRFGGRRFTKPGWHGKQYGKYRKYKSYSNKGHGKHGYGKKGKHGQEYGHGKRRDYGHKHKRDYGKHHRGRDYGKYRNKGHKWGKGRDRDYGHGRRKYMVESSYGGGSGSQVDISSVISVLATLSTTHADKDENYDVHDEKTGRTIAQFNPKDCGCPGDYEKIYQYVIERAKKQFGPPKGHGSMKDEKHLGPPIR